jgi:type III pantothenate kinase
MIGRVIIALNVGNTNVSYGVVEGHELTSTGHVATPTADRVYQIEMMLDEIIGGDSSATSAVNEVVLASVVPAVSAALHELATRRGFELFEADETTIPVPIRTDAAASAGNDRLVNAYAAAQLHGAPAIVVDLGTATTFDVVDAGGSFVGGAIAPGLGLGLDALATRTAQLPRVPIAVPARAIGQQTVEAIQSGAVLGHVGMVDYLVRAISAELAASGSSKPKVVLTGGLSAHAWAKAISGVDVIDPLLTLRGLALLHAHARHPESVAGA